MDHCFCFDGFMARPAGTRRRKEDRTKRFDDQSPSRESSRKPSLRFAGALFSNPVTSLIQFWWIMTLCHLIWPFESTPNVVVID